MFAPASGDAVKAIVIICHARQVRCIIALSSPTTHSAILSLEFMSFGSLLGYLQNSRTSQLARLSGCYHPEMRKRQVSAERDFFEAMRPQCRGHVITFRYAKFKFPTGARHRIDLNFNHISTFPPFSADLLLVPSRMPPERIQ